MKEVILLFMGSVITQSIQHIPNNPDLRKEKREIRKELREDRKAERLEKRLNRIATKLIRLK